MTEDRQKNFVQDAVPHMEPACEIPALSSPSEAALVSIAISLKRIADNMGSGQQGLAEEIRRGIWSGSQDALSDWQRRG